MKKLAYSPDANALGFIELASDYVDARVLAPNVAKTFARPVGTSKIILASNPSVGDVIVVGNVTLTAVASAPTAKQFIPSGTLALTLAALATQLAGAGVVPAAAFTVTDGNTAITATNTSFNVPTKMAALKGDKDGVSFGAYTENWGARFCRLSAGQLFYYCISGVAVTTAVDVSNGLGSISVPATVQPLFSVDDVSSISVVAPAACVVSAEWWS